MGRVESMIEGVEMHLALLCYHAFRMRSYISCTCDVCLISTFSGHVTYFTILKKRMYFLHAFVKSQSAHLTSRKYNSSLFL